MDVTAQSQEELKKYENARYGISFVYPRVWGDVSDDCPQYKNKDCGPHFAIMVNDTKAMEGAPVEKLTPSQIFEKIARSIDVHSMAVIVYDLNKPSQDAKACNCKTLKDFVAWDYNKKDPQSVNFINDNQTTIGKNQTAWQTETTSFSTGLELKFFNVYAINGGIGYKFFYNALQGVTFDRYLEGFKNMLKTVTFTPPTPEKKPSFLNANETQQQQLESNTTLKTNATELKTNPTELEILSHNSFTDAAGYLHVVGEVKNNSPSTANFVKIIGTFYDSNNQVVATDFAYTNPSGISSSGTAPFEIILSSASVPISQISNYKLSGTYD
jgi:hypothetical protein